MPGSAGRAHSPTPPVDVVSQIQVGDESSGDDGGGDKDGKDGGGGVNDGEWGGRGRCVYVCGDDDGG